MTLPWPSSSHSLSCPVLALNQSTSACPSPLKSPTPTTCHSGEHPEPQVRERLGVAMTLPWPSSSHSTRAPLFALNHSTSAYPSPLKSPTPATSGSETGEATKPCSPPVASRKYPTIWPLLLIPEAVVLIAP